VSRPVRPPESYVYGVDGPGVMVPGRIAAWLERAAHLRELRTSVRGVDPELDAVLVALALTAAQWRTRRGVSTDHGTELRKLGTESSGCPLTTGEAADLLDMSERGVRKAIEAGRLQATRHGDVWRIGKEDLEMFRATRNGEPE
jgi:excisionase family DNA binding protein